MADDEGFTEYHYWECSSCRHVFYGKKDMRKHIKKYGINHRPLEE